jgi:hypothetical protein
MRTYTQHNTHTRYTHAHVHTRSEVLKRERGDLCFDSLLSSSSSPLHHLQRLHLPHYHTVHLNAETILVAVEYTTHTHCVHHTHTLYILNIHEMYTCARTHSTHEVESATIDTVTRYGSLISLFVSLQRIRFAIATPPHTYCGHHSVPYPLTRCTASAVSLPIHYCPHSLHLSYPLPLPSVLSTALCPVVPQPLVPTTATTTKHHRVCVCVVIQFACLVRASLCIVSLLTHLLSTTSN